MWGQEKKTQAKGSETKRTRRDPEEMEKIMFRLFEKQPNWTLKQLVQKTDQPEVCNHSLIKKKTTTNFTLVAAMKLILEALLVPSYIMYRISSILLLVSPLMRKSFISGNSFAYPLIFSSSSYDTFLA